MFKNIENKIKRLAYATCIINILISLILGAFMIKNDYIIEGILYIIFGVLISGVLLFSLYAIGEILSKNELLKNRVESIKKEQINIISMLNEQISIKKDDNEFKNDISYKDGESNNTFDINIKPIKIDNIIKCPICGIIQKSDRIECVKCGAKFNTKSITQKEQFSGSILYKCDDEDIVDICIDKKFDSCNSVKPIVLDHTNKCQKCCTK